MSESKKKTFSKRLTQLMEDHPWTRAEFAEAIEVSSDTIRRWQKGESLPRPAQSRKLKKVTGKTLQELGLNEEETKQQESILEGINEIFQKPDDISIGQQLQLIIEYLARIASQDNFLQFPQTEQTNQVEKSASFYDRIQPSLTKHEDMVVRTQEGEEYHFSWLGAKDAHIERVVSIETGNYIASWRYFLDGKQHREPSNHDMHIHVRNGYTIHYDSPIYLVRLHMVPSYTGARCIP